MLGTTDISASLSLTPGGMDRLKLQAKNDPKAAVQAAAQQFEALFLDMMLKSMREAVPEEGARCIAACWMVSYRRKCLLARESAWPQ
jgi:Rod binding domain-containing protein